MVVQGYGLLNSWPHQTSAVRDGHIKWMAAKYGVTAAQLLVRWALQHENMAILVRSTKREHLLENLNVFGFEISGEDMLMINGLNTMFSPFDVQWMHDVYGQIETRPRPQEKKEDL